MKQMRILDRIRLRSIDRGYVTGPVQLLDGLSRSAPARLLRRPVGTVAQFETRLEGILHVGLTFIRHLEA